MRPARARAPDGRDGLYLLNELTSKYGTDARITNLVNSREIWIVPNLNPDGSEYDIATGSYRSWRKNRQPNSGSTAIGTDLNRNWSFQWGCCGGSSGTFSSETYRGPSRVLGARDRSACATSSTAAWSAACSRSRPHIDFHTYSELVLWPYGYTTAEHHVDADRATTEAAFADARPRAWRATNGYTPEQASDLYIADGTIDDWLWGAAQDLRLHVRDVPADVEPRLLSARRRLIGRETTPQPRRGAPAARGRRLPVRGRSAADLCTGDAPADRSTATTSRPRAGWTTNPAAPTRRPPAPGSAANPADTNSSGAKQLGTTTSGTIDLVTGAARGRRRRRPTTSTAARRRSGRRRSRCRPERDAVVLLVPRARLELVVGGLLPRARGQQHDSVVFQQLGAATNRNGAWATRSATSPLRRPDGPDPVRGGRREHRQPRRGGRRRRAGDAPVKRRRAGAAAACRAAP